MSSWIITQKELKTYYCDANARITAVNVEGCHDVADVGVEDHQAGNDRFVDL